MKFIISGKNIEVTECNFKCSEGKTEDRSYHSYERAHYPC